MVEIDSEKKSGIDSLESTPDELHPEEKVVLEIFKLAIPLP